MSTLVPVKRTTLVPLKRKSTVKCYLGVKISGVSYGAPSQEEEEEEEEEEDNCRNLPLGLPLAPRAACLCPALRFPFTGLSNPKCAALGAEKSSPV